MDDLPSLIDAERAAGKRIVLTNGCFDLLHVGHVRNLAACRALGDVLVVGVNGDESVRRLKGPERPLVPAGERAEVLAALRSVDYVTVFAELSAERLVAAVRPDVYAKGADYAAGESAKNAEIDDARLPEAKVVRAHGGRVVLLETTPGRSTTTLVHQIQAVAPLQSGAAAPNSSPSRVAEPSRTSAETTT
jgi:rfaE bifunctional protein nucleotidyltransferase chain/domain